jgi:hypothetical protein
VSAPAGPSRVLVGLIGVCAVTLIVGLLLGVLGDDETSRRSTGANSFSRSAIGHRGCVEFLRRLEIPVSLNLADATAAGARAGVLLVAEPHLAGPDDPQVAVWDSLYAHFYTIVLVLPKWEGSPSAARPGWLGQVWPRRDHTAADVLAALKVPATVVQLAPSQSPHWETTAPQAPPPVLDSAQLLVSNSLEPLWVAQEGMLAGYWRPNPNVDETIVVVADPDLLANHGLARGGNAAHLAALMDLLQAREEGVVVDETLHGFRHDGAAWRALLRFPLSLVLVQALLTAGLAIWLAAGAFGARAPVPPAHAAGHTFLIENTADLLDRGGHGARILQRYHEQALAETVRRLRLDGRLTAAGQRERLAGIGRARGVTTDLQAVEARVLDGVAGLPTSGQQILELAGEIHRWRREMTHGL